MGGRVAPRKEDDDTYTHTHTRTHAQPDASPPDEDETHTHIHTHTDEAKQEEEKKEFPLLAARELLEETAGTVNVPAAHVCVCPYVDTGLFHRYRCYLVVVEGVSCQKYQEARKKNGLPACYRCVCVCLYICV